MSAARLHGVVGTAYQYGPDGIRAAAYSPDSLSYGHPGLRWYLASQLVRRLSEFRVVSVAEL